MLDAKPRSRDSFVWKSIVGVMDIYKSGLLLLNDTEWRWKFIDSGCYSVKSGYELARKWKMDTRTLYGEVSDWNLLCRYGINMEDLCPRLS